VAGPRRVRPRLRHGRGRHSSSSREVGREDVFGIFEMSRCSTHFIRFGNTIVSYKYLKHAVFAFNSGRNLLDHLRLPLEENL
jgi:hypothetical protein